jgi:regulator of nonsense transcripts 2
MIKAIERLTTGVQTLADLLGLSPPVLPTAASLSKSGLQIVEATSSFAVRDDGPIAGGIWDDEEEKKFYEDIVDLQEVVPKGLLGIKEKKAKSGDVGVTEGKDPDATEVDDEQIALEAQRQVEEDIKRQLEELDLQSETQDTQPEQAVDMDRTATEGSMDLEPSLKHDDASEELDAAQKAEAIVGGEDDGLQSGPAARLTALFDALPESNNREVVDKLAIEFAFLNSKAARKRLIRFMGEVPNTRTDLLPHYGRFLATLDKYMPDVSAGVTEIVSYQSRSLLIGNSLKRRCDIYNARRWSVSWTACDSR